MYFESIIINIWKHQKQGAIKFDALLTFFKENIIFPVKLWLHELRIRKHCFSQSFSDGLNSTNIFLISFKRRRKKSLLFHVKNHFWCFSEKNWKVKVKLLNNIEREKWDLESVLEIILSPRTGLDIFVTVFLWLRKCLRQSCDLEFWLRKCLRHKLDRKVRLLRLRTVT